MKNKLYPNRSSDGIFYSHVQGGNVPGGHNVIWNLKKKSPFVPEMGICNSIPLRHSDVVIDIGAYVGTYAIRCARFPVKKVIAYEAMPSTYNILKLTKLPNLETHNIAVVGMDEKEVDLYIARGIGTSNSITKSNRKLGKIKVPAIRYEDAIRDASIVKIDIEGAEYDLNIIQPQLRAIILDFHRGIDCWEDKALKIIADIENAGFITMVKPKIFSNNWSPAGSWFRPMDTIGEFEPMMQGKICCGCGIKLKGNKKSLCFPCWNSWNKRHRDGYHIAIIDMDIEEEDI